MDKEKVYIGIISKKAVGIRESILLKDVGVVFCKNNILKENIENTEIYKSQDEETWDYITNIKIGEILIEKFTNVDLEFSGSDEILLEIKSRVNKNIALEIIKVLFVCTTLFFGASLGIMYFHEDVNMSATLEKLYFTFTGDHKENPLIMNIPYSLGLGVGMISFFIRVFSSSKRRRMEPGPMDVELYLYDYDMEDYILNKLKNVKSKD